MIVLHELAREEQWEKGIEVSGRLTFARVATSAIVVPPRNRPAVVLEPRRGAVLPVASILPKNAIADLEVQHVPGIFGPDNMRPYQDTDLRWQAGDQFRLQLGMCLRRVGQAARACWRESAKWRVYDVRTLPEEACPSFPATEWVR